jgi:N-acetylmuramoyl-L-alanine amidase
MAGPMKVPLAVLSLAILVLLSGLAPVSAATVMVDGAPYVELTRLAGDLKAKARGTSTAATAELRTARHLVRFTRDRARIVADGTPVVLDRPVRVKNGRWLIPKSFATTVWPRLTAPAEARAKAPVKAPARVLAKATARGSEPSALPREVEPRATAALEEMRIRSYPSFTRVVLETSEPVTHKVEASGGGAMRIRVAGLVGSGKAEEVKDGFLDTVKLVRAGDDTVVLATFAGAAGELKATSFGDPPRLVLDFMKPSDPAPRERGDVGPLRTIVLDAGHGGHDPGAIGPGGLMEKELVLDVTRRVTRLVEERLGIKVLLTRDSDQFIALKDRTSFANRKGADLFVSIHANAHTSSGHEGVETYFLSSEATDITARQTAALENSVVQLEKPAPGARGNGRQDLLRAILWDLAQSEFLFESSRLAEVVQDSMTQSLRIPNRGVKQAGFYVLGGAAMPAILIEIGFVTNPREERRLREARYRDDIARAIFSGIAEYKRHWDQRMRTTAERSR